MLNFYTVMMNDANAAMTPEERQASLLEFYSVFGDVMERALVSANLVRTSRGRRRGVQRRA